MYIIKMRIEEEKYLYNAIDPDGNSLSDDVKSYLLDRLQERNLHEKVEIQIITPQDINVERIQSAIHTWVETEERCIKIEYRKNLFKQMWMFGIGVAFIALSLALEDKVGVVWFTVLSTIGAFSMWEAASIWIIQNPKLRLRKKQINFRHDNTQIKIVS